MITGVFDLDRETFKLNLTAQNCPFPMVQYYDWTIEVISQDDDDFLADMDGWGIVRANSTGTICLTGSYFYNPNYVIEYTIQIIE